MRIGLALITIVALGLSATASRAQTADDENKPPEPLVTDPAAASPTPNTPPSTTPATLTPPGARVDVKAEDDYHACQRTLTNDVDEGRKCMQSVVALHPNTEAALKAEAALFALDARLQQHAQPSPGVIPAGRLGITTAFGLFGAWNAVAGGIIAESASNGTLPGQTVVLVTGAAAVVVGAAAGAGGYFLADALKLDEGAARLVGSSLVWGTVVGTEIAPSVAQAISTGNNGNANVALNAGIATVVVGGYVFGGAALLAASNVKLDEAQVSWINSGGLVGTTLGVLLLIDLSSSGASNSVYVDSVAVALSTGVGLGAGALLGQFVDTTWGEVLLCDLGGVLGFVGGGAVGVGLASSVGNGNSSLYFATGATGVGLLLGYGVAFGIVEGWRNSRGAPLLRGQPAGPQVNPLVISLLDVTGHPVTSVGVAGTF